MAPLRLVNPEKAVIPSPLPAVPNSMQTWMQLEELLTIYMELCGNAYLYHNKTLNTFYPLRPSRVKIVANAQGTGVLGYTYYRHAAPQVSNQIGINTYTSPQAENNIPEQKSWMYDNPDLENLSTAKFKEVKAQMQAYVQKGIMSEVRMETSQNYIPFDADEVLHFKFMSPTNDFYGLSPLTALLLSLDTDLYERHWNRKFFENGAVPPGVLIVPTTMSREDFLKRKEEFHKEYGGLENRGKVIVLQGGGGDGKQGATYTPFPSQHKDLEFVEGLRMTRDEVLSLYGVPPVIVGVHLPTSQSSSRSPGVQDQKRMFWQDTIKPKHALKVSVWNKHFDYDPENGDHLAYQYTDIEDLAPDYEKLGRAAYECIRTGMTVGEVRQHIYQLPPVPEGQIYLPSNLQPVSSDEE